MRPSDVLKLPQPPADHRLAYGTDPQQFGELRLPQGPGPFPLVVMLHGGCWEAAHSLAHLSLLCSALAREGMASWNLEFRRLGNPGGGWPGTFQDVAAGIAYVRTLVRDFPIDPKRITLVGHSAGAHLALWLVGAHDDAGDSEAESLGVQARAASDLLSAVVALAPITDLSTPEGVGLCRHAVQPLLSGLLQEGRGLEACLRQISPLHMGPPTVPVRVVTAGLDAVVPESQTVHYLEKLGRGITRAEIAETGHFELVNPGSDAWPGVLQAVKGGDGDAPGTSTGRFS